MAPGGVANAVIRRFRILIRTFVTIDASGVDFLISRISFSHVFSYVHFALLDRADNFLSKI